MRPLSGEGKMTSHLRRLLTGGSNFLLSSCQRSYLICRVSPINTNVCCSWQHTRPLSGTMRNASPRRPSMVSPPNNLLLSKKGYHLWKSSYPSLINSRYDLSYVSSYSSCYRFSAAIGGRGGRMLGLLQIQLLLQMEIL